MIYNIIRKNYYCFINPIPQGKLKQILIKNLSYDNKFYPGIPYWAKKTKLYNDKKGYFMWGLIYRVKKIFEVWQKISSDTYTIEKNIIHKDKVISYYDNELRDYQKDAINEFLHYGLGIIQLPCGSGKTKLSIEIIKQLQLKTLVVVHTKELLKQWKQQYDGDVFTYQKLIRDISILEKYMFILYDECHLCKCKSIKLIAKNSKSLYVLGLSASPQREDGHDKQIEEVCGQVIYKKDTKDLIEQNYLSNAEVYIKDIKYKNDYFETYNELYEDNIVNNIERNGHIINVCDNNSDKYVLVLVDRIEHGEQLIKDIQFLGINVIFFHSTMKKRNKIYEDIKDKKYNIIISTQIFDTGIDLPFLDCLVLACGGKSSVKIIQRVGRVLRQNEGKSMAKIYDFNDNAKILKKHSKRRLDYYNENNFKIHIL